MKSPCCSYASFHLGQVSVMQFWHVCIHIVYAMRLTIISIEIYFHQLPPFPPYQFSIKQMFYNLWYLVILLLIKPVRKPLQEKYHLTVNSYPKLVIIALIFLQKLYKYLTYIIIWMQRTSSNFSSQEKKELVSILSRQRC